MPVPKATGTQGSRRPAPASARIQTRNLSMSDGHAAKPDGTRPPACAAPRGGQVPAKPCVRALPRSAIGYALRLPMEKEATGSCYSSVGDIILDVPKPLTYGCGTRGFVMKSVLSDKHFHNEAAAYAFVEARLWPNGPVCPHCGGVE